MHQPLTTAALALAAGLAAAHEGHGLVGAHWHARDLFGPTLLLIGVAALLWARRK